MLPPKIRVVLEIHMASAKKPKRKEKKREKKRVEKKWVEKKQAEKKSWRANKQAGFWRR